MQLAVVPTEGSQPTGVFYARVSSKEHSPATLSPPGAAGQEDFHHFFGSWLTAAEAPRALRISLLDPAVRQKLAPLGPGLAANFMAQNPPARLLLHEAGSTRTSRSLSSFVLVF
jgi:hypothetical protein